MSSPRSAIAPAAITPATVGARLSAVTAVVAAAVMYGIGLLGGRVVVVYAGWTGPGGTWVPLGVAAAAALFSAQGSARRMLRARARRRASAGGA